MKWYTDEYTGNDTSLLEYDEDNVIWFISECISNLAAPKANLDHLCEEYKGLMEDEDGDYYNSWDCGSSLCCEDYLTEESRVALDEIFSEIMDKLEMNQFIPLDMVEEEELSSEYEFLMDCIDTEIGEYLRLISHSN